MTPLLDSLHTRTLKSPSQPIFEMVTLLLTQTAALKMNSTRDTPALLHVMWFQ